MKTEPLIQSIEARVTELAQAIMPVALHRSHHSRFDRHLFQTHGLQLKDYLLETQNNLAQLQLSVTHGKVDQVAFLAEKLVAQIAALWRELATTDLRKNDHLTPEPENIYEKLASHQEYERRLLQMISDRENQHAIDMTTEGKQKLQRELAGLEGRLLRCRQALARIEQNIERRERRLG